MSITTTDSLDQLDSQSNMISLAQHASELAKLLDQARDPSMWRQTVEWLMVASGIRGVHFDVIRFDDSYGWCSSADEFSAAREELLQQYVTELTLFTYCWSALECAVEAIAPPEAPERGKINGACYYIHQHSPHDNGVPCYKNELHDFWQLIVKSEEAKILRRFNFPSFVSTRSLALYVIYPLRNQFAHGALYFPLPDSDNRPRSEYVHLIQSASRLTLMSIQHLLAAAHENYNTHTWEASHLDGDLTEHEFHAFLASLHIRKQRPDDNGWLL